ncbi:MAG: UDP-glucose 4-epimerase GalE [Desulfuromonadales bacterium GWC2_61_20]|nr:MAG: UDP-glucose 4-epimerase GalE [Desulfuromonadales bacterium GWC2_61_20]HAD04944.1 UDP-glucose 4-epimerase GalE [Desulfuromonas sp.]
MKGAVLVVGGAGYIGSHMVRQLQQAGYAVTVFDNLTSGHRDAVGSASLVVGDLRHPADLAALFAPPRRFALVLHFAALSLVGESVVEPYRYYHNNVAGTLNLLAAMQAAGVGRLVFSSTSAVYGNPQRLPLDEEHPLLPINPYGRSKRMVEEILADAAAAYGLRSIALRYFNAAGADPAGGLGERHSPETHLIPLILQRAARLCAGETAAPPLQVFGADFPTPDGTCIRDYIHVNDLCRAHLLAAERLLAGACTGAEVYNLGNGAGYSVLEVIAACRRVTGRDIPFTVVARRPGDPPELVAAAEKARSVLGWSPAMPALDAIVATVWAWMEAGRGAQEGRGKGKSI